MDKYLWQKTLLELYGGYKTCIATCDNKLTRLVRNAFGNSNSTFDQLDDMRVVVLRKKHCQFAKAIIEKSINNIKPAEQSVLYWRYMRGTQFQDIADKLNLPIRQVFRRYDKELAFFASRLAVEGYSTERIEAEFGSDDYFNIAYEKVCLKRANVAKKPIVSCLISLENASDSIIKKNRNRISSDNILLDI